MSQKSRRYYTRSPDGRAIYGFSRPEAAETAALAYGEGAYVIDTMAKSYQPMLSEVMEGELMIAGLSGWDTGKPGGLDADFIEAAKKHVALTHAFIEKGADINARDENGGTALHWAVGGNKEQIVALLLQCGADMTARDKAGLSPLDLALRRGRDEIARILHKFAASRGAIGIKAGF